MTNNQIKALFIFTAGIVLFIILKPKLKAANSSGNLNFSSEDDDVNDRKRVSEPTMNEKDAKKNRMAKNAFGALKAYIAAYNNKEPQSVLDELNRELAKEFKVKVYRRKSDSKFVVCDLTGKEILVNN
jgi:hypothetical protein